MTPSASLRPWCQIRSTALPKDEDGETSYCNAEGVALLPHRELRGRLASVRLHGEHLFLRYSF